MAGAALARDAGMPTKSKRGGRHHGRKKGGRK